MKSSFETVHPVQKSAQILPIFPEKRGIAPLSQGDANLDMVVFSHLRWDFVFQRPQHLLTRFAKQRRVFYVEEPIFENIETPRMNRSARADGLCIMTPHLPNGGALGGDEAAVHQTLRALVSDMIEAEGLDDYVAWYYTPMALPFTRHLSPVATVYDSMDELSLFKGAHPSLLDWEREMYRRADVMFTGGQSLYDYKKSHHHNIHAFPSSIDVSHFGKARREQVDPKDQAGIPRLRVGFAGVIDERLDIELLDGAARMRPDWQFVMIGPVCKIDPGSLPKHANIHWLGGKNYQELPAYIAGWDAAMLPFARNESTRFISPTKTPEYLAAGRPVVSTSIRDVVCPYGVNGMVEIADSPADFVAAIERAMEKAGRGPEWLMKVDAFLAQNSWDKTWDKMKGHIEAACLGAGRTLKKLGQV